MVIGFVIDNSHIPCYLLLFNITVTLTTSAYSLGGLYFTSWKCLDSVFPTENVHFLLLCSQNCTVLCLKAPLGHH